MRQEWRVAGLGAACATVVLTTACGGSEPSGAEAAASASASEAAAASAGATAAPGTYGAPVDPSLPNPTGVATDSPAPSSSGTSDSVPVVVTYSGWVGASAAVEFGAYVAGVVESGGTCTLTVTSSSGSATAEVAAEPDSSSTSCPLMAVAGTDLSSGTWSAVVSYESPTTSGQSEAVQVVVP